jgi:diguanylate cyclase (GGDEF)-like protein
LASKATYRARAVKARVASSADVAPQRPEDLLHAGWAARGRPLCPREWAVEAAATLVFALVAGALMVLAPGDAGIDLSVVALVFAYAIATRVSFPIGLAGTAPTQLFFVPLFWLAPPQVVPVLVALALAVGTLIGVAAGNRRLDRLACVGGDAVHALGPAAVLVLAGAASAAEAAAWLLGLALASQFLLDLLSGMVREFLVSRVAPRVQTAVQVQVWAGDLALTPVGVLAAEAAESTAGAPLALLPLVALLAYAANDRGRRIAKAHDQLEALKVERERLRLAVRRVGDALAANLDVNGILEIVSATTSDALHSDARRLVYGSDRAGAPAPGADRMADVLTAAGEAAASAGHLSVIDGDEGVHGLACPLHSVRGTLALARRGDPYDEHERALMGHLCRQADVASGNVMQHEMIRRQALTDELTGLANQRRFQVVLDAGVAEHARRGEDLALLLVDLDNFKMVNDEHGHLTGDEVLRAVGRCLRQSCRASDHPARYGGEEFAVTLTGLKPDQILHFAERVRSAIADVKVSTPAGEQLPVTASVGVAWMSATHVSRDDLVAAADAALYDAKRLGKNRVAWVDLDCSHELAAAEAHPGDR